MERFCDATLISPLVAFQYTYFDWMPSLRYAFRAIARPSPFHGLHATASSLFVYTRHCLVIICQHTPLPRHYLSIHVITLSLVVNTRQDLIIICNYTSLPHHYLLIHVTASSLFVNRSLIHGLDLIFMDWMLIYGLD